MNNPNVGLYSDINLVKLPREYQKILSLYDINRVFTSNVSMVFDAVKEWRIHHSQKRPVMNVNRKLMIAAQIRALVIAHTGDTSHDWEGFSPNNLVRSVGFVLPNYYLYTKEENMVQTLFGMKEGNDLGLVFEIMGMVDNKHFTGDSNFFRTQTEIGVGHAIGHGHSNFAFLSAHRTEWEAEEGFDPQI